MIKSANFLRASADKIISTAFGAGARTRAAALFLLSIINSRFNALQHHRYRLISVKGIGGDSGRGQFTGTLQFKVSLLPYEGDDLWVENT